MADILSSVRRVAGGLAVLWPVRRPRRQLYPRAMRVLMRARKAWRPQGCPTAPARDKLGTPVCRRHAAYGTRCDPREAAIRRNRAARVSRMPKHALGRRYPNPLDGKNVYADNFGQLPPAWRGRRSGRVNSLINSREKRAALAETQRLQALYAGAPYPHGRLIRTGVPHAFLIARRFCMHSLSAGGQFGLLGDRKCTQNF